MNKKIIFIGLAVVMVLLVFMLIVSLSETQDDTPHTGQDLVFPDAVDVPSRNSASSRTLEIATLSDLKFAVSNFVDNEETVKDPVNTGTYILAGSAGYCLSDGNCPSGFDTNNFSVSYSRNQDFFTLVVLTEPITDTRKEAESFLMSRLGIGEQDMCQLHYSFSAPYWVNEFYAGQELGFSFCPGSVSLE